MGTVLSIDLNKNPEVAALVADKEPGSKIYGCFTIKDRDDQTVNIRIKEMAATCDELKENASDDEETGEAEDGDDQSPEGAEAEAPVVQESPAKKMAKQMESNAPDGY